MSAQRDFNQYVVTRKPGTVSPGRVLLLRAAVYYDQVERSEMSELEAFESLAPEFYELMRPFCDCSREICERMERLYPHVPPMPKKGTAR